MTQGAPVAIVAGSGISLDPLLDSVEWRRPFSDFPGLPEVGVAGHRGCFTRGLCQGTPIIVQSGRLHFYEGLRYNEVIRTVDVLHALGAGAVLFTNAAGGLLRDMRPGALVAIDRVTTWPYAAWRERPETVSPSWILPGLSDCGTYIWVPGPNYETRAEIAALRVMGGVAVGMSTAPELFRAHALGMRTAVVSCITNNCCAPQVLTHEHVIETARRASESLIDLIRDTLPAWIH